MAFTGNQHFSPFPAMFSTLLKQTSIFGLHLCCCLQMLSIWTSLKYCCLEEITLVMILLDLKKKGKQKGFIKT